MTRVRRALGPIAAVWLICQAATLALVPALLDIDLAACGCTYGADASCPMHHQPGAGARVCVMHGTTPSATAALGSLLGIVGLVPSPLFAMAPAPSANPVLLDGSRAARRPSPPDPPPPRS